MSYQNHGKSAELWKLHDTYHEDISNNRIVTRSQTAFLRLKNTPSDLRLFSDKNRQDPSEKPHLMVALKGCYGSVPRTVVMRDVGKEVNVDEELCAKVNAYKSDNSMAGTGRTSVIPWF